MAEIADVIAEVKGEVAKYGTDLKSLHEKTQQDLAAIRSQYEGLTKGEALDPVFKQKLEAYGAGVSTRMEEATKAANARMDTIETSLKRIGHNGGPALEADDYVFAEAHTKAAWQLEGKSFDPVIDPKDVDVKGWQEYARGFQRYMKSRDDKLILPDHFKTLQVGSDPDGGYMVEARTSARILKKVWELSPFRPLASVETISGTELDFRLDNDETDFEWVGETDLPTAGKTPQLGRKKIVAHQMAARPKATQMLLEDASVDMAAWLAGKVADKFARGEARAFLVGTGRGMPRGLLTYPDGDPETQGEVIQQFPSGTSDGFTYKALTLMIYSLKEPYHANATFAMQRGSIAKVMLMRNGLDGESGTYVYQASLMPGERGFQSNLHGYPIVMMADMPVMVPGALAVAFGDFRETYTILDRLGLTTLRDPYTVKPFIEFYTRRRVGGDVVKFESMRLMKGAALV